MATTFKSQFVRHLASNPKGKRNALLQKGFTLVELMVVIVIVGILSAVALPKFLSQTEKAKGTEAKTLISGFLKEAAAAYVEGASTVTTLLGAPPAGNCPVATKYFAFACTEDSGLGTVTVTATGTAESGSLSAKTFKGVITLPTNRIVFDTEFK
jgi:type IV pilus assembly protein PilA